MINRPSRPSDDGETPLALDFLKSVEKAFVDWRMRKNATLSKIAQIGDYHLNKTRKKGKSNGMSMNSDIHES